MTVSGLCHLLRHKQRLCQYYSAEELGENCTAAGVVTNKRYRSNNHAMRSKKDNLSMKHINIQSLLSGLDEVKNSVLEINIDVACISKTWLTSRCYKNT